MTGILKKISGKAKELLMRKLTGCKKIPETGYVWTLTDNVLIFENCLDEATIEFNVIFNEITTRLNLIQAYNVRNLPLTTVIPNYFLIRACSDFTGIPVRNMILHFEYEKQFQVRTAVSQIDKFSYIKNNEFKPSFMLHSKGNWGIEITDHMFWSTSQLS
jgi:hypothetical protein